MRGTIFEGSPNFNSIKVQLKHGGVRKGTRRR